MTWASVRECHQERIRGGATYSEHLIIRRPVLFACVISCVAVAAVVGSIIAIYVVAAMAAAQID